MVLAPDSRPNPLLRSGPEREERPRELFGDRSSCQLVIRSGTARGGVIDSDTVTFSVAGSGVVSSLR
jgi:hypothetical protein